MSPYKTKEQVAGINTIATTLFAIVQRHILTKDPLAGIVPDLCRKYALEKDTAISWCVSNLIGLFIQSYDAGRGILSNALLSVLTRQDILHPQLSDKKYMASVVLETVRFDPPVHNTRRIAIEDMCWEPNKDEGRMIRKGETLMLVLAAANRDPRQFQHPTRFDLQRNNNGENLTFGMGPHACIANHFALSMATETLCNFLRRYPTMVLADPEITYEPLVNVRLPQRILLSLRAGK